MGAAGGGGVGGGRGGRGRGTEGGGRRQGAGSGGPGLAGGRLAGVSPAPAALHPPRVGRAGVGTPLCGGARVPAAEREPAGRGGRLCREILVRKLPMQKSHRSLPFSFSQN